MTYVLYVLINPRGFITPSPKMKLSVSVGNTCGLVFRRRLPELRRRRRGAGRGVRGGRRRGCGRGRRRRRVAACLQRALRRRLRLRHVAPQHRVRLRRARGASLLAPGQLLLSAGFISCDSTQLVVSSLTYCSSLDFQEVWNLESNRRPQMSAAASLSASKYTSLENITYLYDY